MSPIRLVVALITLIVVGGVAFLWLSPSLTGEDYLKDFFLHQLEQNLGRKIEVHRIKLVIFPTIRLEMKDIIIYDRNAESIMLSAKKLDLVLRLVPLLRKQVVGKRLLVEDPTFTIRRDRSGRWNFLDRDNPLPTEDDEALQMMARIFRIREATIVNG
ncbi:MAG TPA: AsmA family protein, partial [Nitrospira sp.]|nr:AsmA family protein [Nitrospira sp.]